MLEKSTLEYVKRVITNSKIVREDETEETLIHFMSASSEAKQVAKTVKSLSYEAEEK